MSQAIVVVPCYNEAARLDATRFQEFAAENPAVEFLFVNDGSKDGTQGVLECLHAVNPGQLRYLHLERNSGKAEAVRQGMLKAFESQPAYVGFWDADLATPLEEIPHFCRVLDQRPDLALVIGSRIRLLGHKIERRTMRRLLGRLFARVAGTLLGVGIHDTQCGAKLFRADERCAELFAEPFLVRWIFDVELLARLRFVGSASGLAPLEEMVYEYPLNAWREVAGSKLRAIDFPKSLGELWRIYHHYLRPGLISPGVVARLAAAGHPAEQSPLSMSHARQLRGKTSTSAQDAGENSQRRAA